MKILKDITSILWPYTLCGALVLFMWFFDLRPYVPYSAVEIMIARSVLYSIISIPAIYFCFKGISSPKNKLHQIISVLIFLTILAGLSYLMLRGITEIQAYKPFLEKRYFMWAAKVSTIYFVPILFAAVTVFISFKSLFIKGFKLVDDNPYGSARLCSSKEAMEHSDKNGLPLGRILSSINGDEVQLIDKILSSKGSSLFKYKPIHSFLIAPTRAGKGVGFVVPTLLDYDGPVIAIDPKSAENFSITARHRRKNGIRKIHVFDTCELTGEDTACINIFDFLDPEHPKFVDTIKGFSASLSPTSGDERVDYFNKAAQKIITCLIIYVCSFKKCDRNLSTVFSLLSSPPEELFNTFQEIYENKELSGGTASRAAAKVLSTEKKELSSCINSARDALDFLDSPAYVHMTSKTNFNLVDVFENKADIFFCIPIEEIESHGHYFIRLALSLIVREIKHLDHPPKTNILFLLDEMAAIGKVREVKSILLAGAGYGISLMGISQSIESLQSVYPTEIKTMLSSSLVMFLGIRENSETEYLSKRLGSKTVFSESNSTNDGASSSKNSSTKSAVKRDILTPSEICDLNKKYVIAFVEDLKPMILGKTCYYSDKEFRGMFDKSRFR